MARLVAERAIHKRVSGNGNLRKAVNKHSSFEKSRLGMSNTDEKNVKGGFNADDVQSHKDLDISELCEVYVAEDKIASKPEKCAGKVEIKQTAIEEAEITVERNLQIVNRCLNRAEEALMEHNFERNDDSSVGNVPRSRALDSSHVPETPPHILALQNGRSWADEVDAENLRNALVFHAGTSVSPKQKQCPDFLKEEDQSLKLKYFEPSLENQELIIKPTQEVFKIGASWWKTSLVGFLLDRKLPCSEVDVQVRKLWGNTGLLDVLPYFNDFYIFKFKTKEESESVLKEGPWHIAGQPLFLQSWQPGMSFDKHEITAIPIWINLYKLPLELWSELGLSYVASAIGKPIKTDSLTASRKRISYARICVEIYPDSILPGKFKISLEDGSRREIFVDYGWIPRTCENCKVYGHHHNSCKKSSSSATAKQQCLPKTQKNLDCEEEGNEAKNVGEEGVTVQNKRKKTGLNAECSAQSAMRKGDPQ